MKPKRRVNVCPSTAPHPGPAEVAMNRFLKRLVANIDALIWNLSGGLQPRH
jgi:hypothetical protein